MARDCAPVVVVREARLGDIVTVTDRQRDRQTDRHSWV